MKPSLAIAIPTFNNPALLQICLQSLKNQTNKNFVVYIFDDSGNNSLLHTIKQFKSLKITYFYNQNNLGALPNMCFAFNFLAAKYKYVMVLHDDDFLHHQYTQVFYEGLSKVTIDIALFIPKFVEVAQNSILPLPIQLPHINYTIATKADLCLKYLQGMPFAFGSIIYNTKLYKTMSLQNEMYAEFADRPFVLNNLASTSFIALVENDLYYYRSHGRIDTRWKALTQNNVFNLLEFYKSILIDTKIITAALFKKYATGFLVESYKNLQFSGNAKGQQQYFINAFAKGFISLKYLLLQNSSVNKFATKLKQL